MSPTTRDIRIEVHLDPDDWTAGLHREARAGLAASRKHLSPTWLYDERGSELFEAITELREYYPTRTERAILVERAPEIARLADADTLVELGSGTSDKTRIVLDAMGLTGRLQRYVPFDVAEATLRAAAETVADEHPGLLIEGVVGDFRRHLGAIPAGGRRLFAFLGGTIGNLTPQDRSRFLGALVGAMAPGDSLLLGTDLVKDVDRLISAYDDAGGVTAEFDRNVLVVLNRELGADFRPERFDHVAVWDADNEWVEMRLRSRDDQAVSVPGLDLALRFTAGEELRTEISAKFRRHGLWTELIAAGLRPQRWFTDPDGDFALTVAVR